MFVVRQLEPDTKRATPSVRAARVLRSAVSGGRGRTARTCHVLTMAAPRAFDDAFRTASVRLVVSWTKGHHPNWLVPPSAFAAAAATPAGGATARIDESSDHSRLALEVSINLPFYVADDGDDEKNGLAATAARDRRHLRGAHAAGGGGGRRALRSWAVVAISDRHRTPTAAMQVAREAKRGGRDGRDKGDVSGGARRLGWCGTGHPSAPPAAAGDGGRFVVTDAYHKERRFFEGLRGAARFEVEWAVAGGAVISLAEGSPAMSLLLSSDGPIARGSTLMPL